MKKTAVVLVAHGTVETLDELPEFLANIRRGHPAPPELLAEVRRRYEAIGGQSPLNSINRDLASRLEARLGMPVRNANRLFHPYPAPVLSALAEAGIERIVVVPLAQHSAPIYVEAVKAAARDAGLALEVLGAGNWGRTPELTLAFARAIAGVLSALPDEERAATTVLLTAHSLPKSIVDAGDPYEVEFRASAEAVAAKVRELVTSSAPAFGDHEVAFQSQGMSTGPGGRPMAWLGPDLRAQLGAIAARGRKSVLVAPVGFLADHVEILYDLDIEARSWADELGITLRRAPSLNAGDDLVEALTSVVESVARQPGRGE